MGIDIELEVGDLEHGGGDRARTPRDGLDAREQFLEREWLGDVIVGSGTERFDLRIYRVLCSQHEHRFLKPAGPEVAQNVDSGPTREPQVKQDQVVRLRQREPLAFLAIRHEIDRVALLLEPALDELPDGRVVLDH